MPIDTPIPITGFKTSQACSDSLSIAGYASVFNEIDSYNDIVVHGAFHDSIVHHHQGKTIKLLWQHEATKPIGTILRIKEDGYGLYIEAALIKTTQQGNEAIELIKQKAINGLSIGFNIVKSYLNEQGNRVITKLDLWEVSLVTFPANCASTIISKNREKTESLYLTLMMAHSSLNKLRNS